MIGDHSPVLAVPAYPEIHIDQTVSGLHRIDDHSRCCHGYRQGEPRARHCVPGGKIEAFHM
jgi:hypothetical protein